MSDRVITFHVTMSSALGEPADIADELRAMIRTSMDKRAQKATGSQYRGFVSSEIGAPYAY